MKFIKNNLKVIVAVIVTMFLTGGIVGATVYQYQASDIKYGNTTVGAAVGDLYTNVNAQGGSYGLKVDQLVYSSTTCNSYTCSYTCPSGKTCLAFYNIAYINSTCYIYVMGTNARYLFYSDANSNSKNYLSNHEGTGILKGGETIYVYHGNNKEFKSLVVYTLK